jgi:hypothetical protein
MTKQAEKFVLEVPKEEKKDEKEDKEEKEADEKEKEKEKGESTIHRLNPQLTMGENLADLGGLSLACKGLFNIQHTIYPYHFDLAHTVIHVSLFFPRPQAC